LSQPADAVVVDGRVITRGCRVRLAANGRIDQLDSVLAGKTGRVDTATASSLSPAPMEEEE
jgi:hypothetical protein